jgi:secreted PhoX family phosphatase
MTSAHGAELERRAFLRGLVGAPLLLRGVTWGGWLEAPGGDPDPGDAAGALGFASVPKRDDDALHVPEGYAFDVLLRWGDPLSEGSAPFAAEKLTAEEQRGRFGINCDFNAFFALEADGSRGLLCVNHEFPSPSEMFRDPKARGAERVAVEICAVGLSVVEIARGSDGRWSPVPGSRYNRRVTAESEIEIRGPCAGHPWLPLLDGRAIARGTLANCSGGKTPWRTVLSGEENFQEYFGTGSDGELEPSPLYADYGLAGPSEYGWERYVERFHLGAHPDEPNLFGWIVELDPFDPGSRAVKRTALGRFKHEGATAVLSRGGRAVVYMGDDEREQFLYKFVSEEAQDPARSGRGPSGRELLDHGRLYAARCEADGTGRWLALVPEGVLAGRSQAEILIGARAAARELGATPMDRPEGVAVDPTSGRVYAALTKDSERSAADPVNPRPWNLHGQILEIDEGGDAAATSFRWSHFLVCGPEGCGSSYAGVDPSRVSPVSCPDNLAFDALGNLWIATDGQAKAQQSNDALYAVATAGAERGLTKRFLTGPAGCEISGPEFTPDGRTLFVSVQHPGQGRGIGGERSSRWPDGGDGPPRAAVVAVRRADGGRVGA